MANSANTILTGSVSSADAATTIANAHSTDHGVAGDQRRLYDLSDRVAELSPDESPFFVYLNKVSKVPTTDPVFRFLENRSKIDWTNRTFNADSALGSLAAGVSGEVAFENGSDASVDWLLKGMVVAVDVVDGKSHAIVRIDSVSHETTQSTCQVTCLSVGHSDETGYDAIADGDKCQVIGTAFEEGSGSPDVWSKTLDDDFGYTQIFKTAAEMTNTAIATNYRGYANEWQRIWNLKLREHKVDIERAMLFGQKGRQNGVQSSAGLVGDIIVRRQAEAIGSLTYSAGAPYFGHAASTAVTYDTILSDFETFFDPARGGGSSKLALAGLPVISFFNKVGDGSFVTNSLSFNANAALSGAATTTNQSPHQMNWSNREGSFGHKVMMLNTVHGDLNIIREPLFRGMSGGMMLMADMGQLAYRPLVGNGLNRDTHIVTNVQQADEDLRKDMILTEAGLEITIPETHCLYSFTDLN